MDILQEQPQEVDNSELRAILDRAGALTASSISSYCYFFLCTLPSAAQNLWESKNTYWASSGGNDRRKAQCVAGGCCTACNSDLSSGNHPAVPQMYSAVTVTYNTTDVLRRSPDDLFKLNITAPHRAGSATAMRSTRVFAIFLYFNSIIFLSTIASLAILVPPDGFVGAILAVFSLYLCFGYFSSLMIITQASDRWFAAIIIGFSPLYVYIAGGALIIGTYGVTLWLIGWSYMERN